MDISKVFAPDNMTAGAEYDEVILSIHNIVEGIMVIEVMLIQDNINIIFDRVSSVDIKMVIAAVTDMEEITTARSISWEQF